MGCFQGRGRGADLGHMGPGAGGGRVGEQSLDGGQVVAGEFPERVGGEEDVTVFAVPGGVVAHGFGLLREAVKDGALGGSGGGVDREQAADGGMAAKRREPAMDEHADVPLRAAGDHGDLLGSKTFAP